MPGLLDLSAELRNIIYEEVIACDGNLLYELTRNLPPTPPPSICRTSQQLRAETLPIWRGQTIVVLDLSRVWPVNGDSEDVFQGWLFGARHSGMQHARLLSLTDDIKVKHESSFNAGLSIHVAGDYFVVDKWYTYGLSEHAQVAAEMYLQLRTLHRIACLEELLGRPLQEEK